MAKLDEKYQKQLNSISNFLEEMEKAGVFPIKNPVSGEDCKKETIVKQIETLKRQKFTIATCGSVKAGKSTFLNDLLFGKDVLPYSDVPCTAKLTFISHIDGDPYFEVFYYTREEFSTIKKALKAENEDAFGELNQKVAESMQKGVSFSEVAGNSYKSSQTRKLDDLFKKLDEFVAADGPKTPFVKEVHIYINRPELANIDIVDTPGLNDPNPLNSLETINYAKNAHALIYIMGWKGLDQSDMKFLSESFGMSDSDGVNNRVFIISHIDENSGWVDTKKKFEEQFRDEKVYGVSAYVSLLQKKKDAGYTLSEDDAWTLKQLENEDFEPDRDHVAEKISDLLYKREGEIRVHRVKETIETCLKWKDNFVKKELDRLNKSIEDCEKNSDSLQKELDKIQKVESNLDKKSSIWLTEVKDKLSEWSNKETSKIEDDRKASIKEAERYINGYNGVKVSVARFPNHVSEAVRSVIKPIQNDLAELNEIYKERYTDLEKKVTLLYCEESSEEILTTPEVTSFANYFNEIINKISIEVSSSDVRELISFWHFDATNNEILKSNAVSIISSSFKNVKTAIDSVVGDMHKTLQKYTEVLKADVNKTRDDKRKKYEMDKGEKDKQKSADVAERNKIQKDILPTLARLKSNLNDSVIMGG